MVASSLQAIVLAAGKSSRFKTHQSKLLFPLCGQEMILYPIKNLKKLSIPTTLIVGHQQDAIRSCITNNIIPDDSFSLSFVEQTEQRGTGHALLCTRSLWNADTILIMNGDMPLVSAALIEKLIEHHNAAHLKMNAAITFVTAHNTDPSQTGYGRVIKTDNGIEIVEARNFIGDPHAACCINAGIYVINRKFLEQFITHLTPNEVTQELYLTDLIKIAQSHKVSVETYDVSFDTIRGINTLKELWTAEHIKRSELISYWMEQGVHFAAAQNTIVDADVTMGANSFIGAGVHILKGTRIGNNCSIQAFSYLSNSTLHDNVVVAPYSTISDSVIHEQAHIGPYAHVHNKSTIHTRAVIGNFVEVNRSSVGEQSKAKHLSYLGDAQLGKQVNVGAGTITANYNGVAKEKTIIHDNAHIGSNNVLVAPVTIGAHSITAAGSVITDSVPANALAIARARQSVKEGYAPQLRERYMQQKEKLFIGARKETPSPEQDSDTSEFHEKS